MTNSIPKKVTIKSNMYAIAAELPSSIARQLTKAWSVNDSVAVPGPPLVITLGRSTILKASIIRIRTRVLLTGRMPGTIGTFMPDYDFVIGRPTPGFQYVGEVFDLLGSDTLDLTGATVTLL